MKMKRLICLCMTAVLMLLMLPTAMAEEEKYVENKTGSDVEVYAEVGDTASSSIFAAGAKEKLQKTVTKDGVDWYKISSGYVKKVAGIVLVKDAPTPKPTEKPGSTQSPVGSVTIVNCKKGVNVREKASGSSKSIGEAKKGVTYNLLGQEGKWYKIQYTATKVGYVFQTYVKVNSGTVTPTPKPTEETLPADGTATIVNCSTSCNVRKGAGTNHAKIGTAKKGATYPLLGKEGKWYKIQYTASQVGYVHANYIKVSGTVPGTTPTPSEEPETTDGPAATGQVVTIVNCSTSCNVRKGAGTNHAKIGTAKKGNKYTYLAREGSWYKIQYTDSKVGYIHTNYGKLGEGKPSTDSGSSSEGNGTIVNCSTSVNVRAKATKNSTLLGTLKKGASVTVLGKEGSWTKISFKGKTAYVFSKYVKTK